MSGDSTPATVIYKDVPNFPGYRVGDDGSVWTKRKRGGAKTFYDSWRPMKPRPDKVTGYLAITLRQGAGVKPKTFSLHRLILLVFVGPCPDGMEGAHQNGIKTDCRLSNLAWKTPTENHADKKKHGTTARGERQGLAKLTETAVREIKTNPDGLSGAQLAAKHGTTKGNVNKIRRGEIWAHVA